MSAPEAAALTAALLVRKGTAVPAGYTTLLSTVRSPRVPNPSEAAPLPAAAGDASPLRLPRPRLQVADTRARISLRLDEQRHLKLKLTAAHLHKKLQDVVIAALDGYLDQIGPAVMSGRCACLERGCAMRGERHQEQE